MELLDTVRPFETPEGVDLELHVAGPAVRAIAWLLDAAIRFGAYLVILPLLAALGELGSGGIFLALFLMEWFYPVLFEVLLGGTPGKLALGLAVVHDNGTPLGWSAGLLRNLLRAVDFLPVGYGVGLVSCLLDRDFRRLGDLAAGTLVVYRNPGAARGPLPEGPSRPPPLSLTLEERRAILDFAERAAVLSPERREELAALLAPVTGRTGPEGVEALLGYANWIARGR